MRRATDVGALTGHLAMAGAIVAVVAIGAIVDAQVDLARAAPVGSALSVRAIPLTVIAMLSAVVAFAAALINFFLQALDRRRLCSVSHWMLLGIAFCLMLFGFPLTDLGFTPASAFALSLAAALLAALGVRLRLGVPLPPSSI